MKKNHDRPLLFLYWYIATSVTAIMTFRMPRMWYGFCFPPFIRVPCLTWYRYLCHPAKKTNGRERIV